MTESVQNTEFSEAVSTAQEALEVAGGFGMMQYRVTLLATLIFWVFSSAMASIPFLELQPVYLCTYQNSPESPPYECLPSDFCNKPEISVQIDYTEKTSLHNWTEQLDLSCKEPYEIGLLGSANFLGTVVALPFVGRFADLFGRKVLIIAGLILILTFNFAVFFITSLNEAYVL